MRAVCVFVSLALLGGWIVVGPAVRAPLAQEDEFRGLPEGPGRGVTYYSCSSCHSILLVKQQRMTRADWDETLVYMVEEQSMARLDAVDRSRILDYLGKYLGRDVPR